MTLATPRIEPLLPLPRGPLSLAVIELLNERIRRIDGVEATETFVYLKLQKQLYNWGTR